MMSISTWADGEVPATLRASQLLEWGAARLTEAGIETASLDARLLVQHTLGLSREDMLREDAAASDSAVALFDALINRRLKREPVAKILGRRAFWKYEFIVSGATLDPRPDSETLIEAALAHRPAGSVRRILDLGTGTGCLLLSLLGEYGQAQGVGVDVSEQALKVARENARQLGMEERAAFRLSDWCAQVGGTFDLIVSNPPYIAQSDADSLMPEVRKYDPFIALFGGADGLDAYRALLPQAYRHLETDGVLLLELGVGQADAVETLACAHGFTMAGRRADLAGVARVLILQKEASDKT